jgi:hypothetical protein
MGTSLNIQIIFYLSDSRAFLPLFHPFLLYNLNPASVAFAKDTRHQAGSRMTILQALYNAVDLVKEALPKGSVFPK